MTTVSSNSVNSDIAVSTTSGTVNKVISSPLTEEITVSSANGNLKILKTESPDDITVGSENALTYLVTEKLTEQEISAGVYKGPKGDDGADGNDGADGAQGIQGEKGDTGDTGPQGDPTTNYLVDNA
ncbi:MAG: hypothetical protein GY940_27680, partial [bacterium]|nr:hypothetical protein [bacterium]